MPHILLSPLEKGVGGLTDYKTLKLAAPVDNNKLTQVSDRLISELYSGQASKQTNSELFKQYYSGLSAAVEEGYGRKLISVEFGTPNHTMLKNLKYNAGVFSAFRNHAMSADLVKTLKDDNGNLKSWSHFKKDAAPITGKYNQDWLQTEYNTAVSMARSATQWEQAVRTKHLYPNLKYLASRAADPRDTHRVFWNMVRPIDDPFWDTHLPPSDYNCKCSFMSVDTPATALPQNIPQPPAGFGINPGKTGKIFAADHPYYQIPLGEGGRGIEFQRISKEAHNALMDYTRREVTEWAAKTYLSPTKEGLRKSAVININGIKTKAIINKQSFKEILYVHTDDAQYYDRIITMYSLDTIIKESQYVTTEQPRHPKPGVKRFLVFRAHINGQHLELKFRETIHGIYLYYMRFI